MLKRVWKVSGLLAIWCLPLYAQADDKAVFISEVAYYDKLIFKIRPSYTFKKELADAPSLELLLGKPFRLAPFRFVLYADAKSDFDETVHIGPRLAAIYRIRRTFFGVEAAYFFGLNEESDDHFKAIPYVLHRATDKLNIGLLNVGDYFSDRLSTSFGPFITYSFSKNLNVLVRYGSDFRGGNRLDLKVNFRFGKGRKERPAP